MVNYSTGGLDQLSMDRYLYIFNPTDYMMYTGRTYREYPPVIIFTNLHNINQEAYDTMG